MELYTYCLRFDNGSAPNPYWDICTLTICKPDIRRTANKGDWVVGLGSANSRIGDISDCVVYAMKVTDKIGLWGYDNLCQKKYPGKIPDWDNTDFKRQVGDCIYDFSNGPRPAIRVGVHDERNRETDLSGINALISDYFYYFGDNPVKLPQQLRPLIHKQQKHRVKLNRPYVEQFVQWIERLGFERNKLYGEPQLKSEFESDPDIRSKCAGCDLEDEDDGEVC